MPVTLHIGEGWNPFAALLDWRDDEGNPYPLDGIDIAASAAKARVRFFELMAFEIPGGVTIRMAPAHEDEQVLWDDDFSVAELDAFADDLGHRWGGDASLRMHVNEAILSTLHAALENRDAWIVRTTG